MFLDLVLVIILVLAIIKGYQRGLIVGIFSFIAIIIGLAAALKLSTLAAGYIGNAVNVSAAWLPIVSFAVVFIIVVLLVRLGANMIQRTVEFSMLGWVNRLGGILFYVAIFVVVYSIVLFYADQVHFINNDAKEKSMSYAYVQPWGPQLIDGMGSIVPFFKGMFSDLQNFFDGVANKLPEATTSK